MSKLNTASGPISNGPFKSDRSEEITWSLGEAEAKLIVHAPGRSTGLACTISEHIWEPGDQGGFHRHLLEDEAFYVLEGDYSVFVGDDVIAASPGTWIWGPRDVPHGYQVHSDRGRHLSLMMPGGFEAFFEEVAAIATPDADPGQEMGRLTEVAARYDVELLGPPGVPT
jgi:quercetin dioxygenase-like cupin family protein